jgi:signal transduction histidine kinase
MKDVSKNNTIHIMIVEDENIVALDMRYRLEAFGYGISAVVATGDAAVSQALALKPDLVLMDIQLKGTMDGVESARRIRMHSEIPIVFVTAFTDEATLERVKGSDAYGYIVKPYHERELRIAIELGLSKHRYEMELRIAKEAAEASDKAKTRFLSNVSHELKTPLNSIIGFMDLAAGSGDAGEVAEYIAHTAQAARRLETIIDSILDYTKLEFGALAPIHADFELEQFLIDCWMPFADDARAKGIAPRMYLDPDLPRSISGDEGKLKIIVRNLLDNAVKFTDSGHVLLSAESALSDPGKKYMSLCVSDTGSGIPHDRLSVAFALFTQIDDSTTRSAGGMGLGLPLAKALADLLQVHMECSSKPGTGTEFELRIELPPGHTAAWPPAPRGKPVRVGLYGKSYARDELLRWAPRFGLDLVEVGEKGEGLEQCEALIVDCDVYTDAPPGVRSSLSGAVNDRLLLLGGRCGKNTFPDKTGNIHLTYPPSLGAFVKAIDMVLCRASTGVQLRSEHQSSPPSTGVKRDYGKLVRSARSEADTLGVGQDVEAMLSAFRAEFLKEDWTGLERLVKVFHDRFSDAGAEAGAKLALAVSMDLRNGMGREIDSALAALNIRG